MRKDAPIISCFHLDLSDATRQRKALDDICIEVERGSWSEIVGPAGGGKTLLFSVLSLRAAPPRGTKVVVGGRNLDRLPVTEIADMRRLFGSACAQPIMLDDRSVIENLVVPFVVRGESRMALESTEALLEACELMHLRDVCVCVSSVTKSALPSVCCVRSRGGRRRFLWTQRSMRWSSVCSSPSWRSSSSVTWMGRRWCFSGASILRTRAEAAAIALSLDTCLRLRTP